MERITRFSFGILKLATMSLIFIYMAIVITVGAAGHDSWNTASFLTISVYSIFLLILLFKFQKNKSKATGTFLLVLLIPLVALLLYYIFMILFDILSGKTELIEIKIGIISVLFLFIAASIFVIKEIIFKRQPN